MKFKILLRKTPVDEYAHELCYDALIVILIVLYI